MKKRPGHSPNKHRTNLRPRRPKWKEVFSTPHTRIERPTSGSGRGQNHRYNQQCGKNQMVLGRAHQPLQRRPMDLACHHLETIVTTTHSEQFKVVSLYSCLLHVLFNVTPSHFFCGVHLLPCSHFYIFLDIDPRRSNGGPRSGSGPSTVPIRTAQPQNFRPILNSVVKRIHILGFISTVSELVLISSRIFYTRKKFR